MSAVNEGLLRRKNGAAGTEDAFVGLVWLKRDHREAVSLGLHDGASRSARIHQGREQPAGEPPSVVICFPSVEEVAPEVRSARALAPNAIVLVFAPVPNPRLARAALGAGAAGLLHGGMGPEQILRAVGAALGGETVLPRGLLAEWVSEQRPPDLGALLSARQREILEFVAEGSTNAEIAGRLYLSESTVKQHLRAAYKALGVRNRREAATCWRNFSRWYVKQPEIRRVYS